MNALRLDHLLDFLTSTEFFLGVLWSGLALVTLTLLVLSLTRWGQYQPVRKCLILSIVAHLLMAGYSTTVHIITPAPPTKDKPIHVAINEEMPPEDSSASRTKATKPWEAFADDPERPEPVELARVEPTDLVDPQRQTASQQPQWEVDPSLTRLPLATVAPEEPDKMPAQEAKPTPRVAKDPEPIEAPAAQRREVTRTEVPQQPKVNREGFSDEPLAGTPRRTQAGLPSELLDRPVRIPRLDEAKTSEGPGDLLAGMPDLQSSANQGRPADLYSPPAPPSGPTDRGMPSDGEAGGPQGDRLSPRSLAQEGPASPDPLASLRPSVSPALLPVRRQGPTDHQVPEAYKLRVAPDRSRLAERQGATPETEKAVKAALKWLADNQEPDGRWNARRHGGGFETMTAGRDRQSAGSRADTAMTGLALLALLAAGHTHREGVYSENVRRGLNYLIQIQRSDGGLGGNAANFEYNYSHAMATLAISEAYGMTGDSGLDAPVRKAIGYTLANQNPTTGGWRYNSWDAGDTSQLGWQWMSLKSAELAGIPIPEKARSGVIRFLGTVSSGTHRGLASYRTGEAVTRPMTAEALVCRQLLGLSPNAPSAREAGEYLLGQLPGQGEYNVYYWYYGTLAMYQLQGGYWERWNEALQKYLVSKQRTDGSLAGTWDPDPVWGGYGGRVYSTALAALCLEVYYRYLPLYLQANPSQPSSR